MEQSFSLTLSVCVNVWMCVSEVRLWRWPGITLSVEDGGLSVTAVLGSNEMSVCGLQVWHPAGIKGLKWEHSWSECTCDAHSFLPQSEVVLPLPRQTLIHTWWPLTLDLFYSKNKHIPTQLSPQITTCCLPMQPSLVNSSMHHPVLLAATCTLFALKVSLS